MLEDSSAAARTAAIGTTHCLPPQPKGQHHLGYRGHFRPTYAPPWHRESCLPSNSKFQRLPLATSSYSSPYSTAPLFAQHLLVSNHVIPSPVTYINFTSTASPLPRGTYWHFSLLSQCEGKPTPRLLQALILCSSLISPPVTPRCRWLYQQVTTEPTQKSHR